MEFSINTKPLESVISLSGQFIFTDNIQFRHIVEAIDKMESRKVTLELSEVEFIDSAGLGMLLLLRDICDKKRLPLTLKGASGQVEKIFSISKFDVLFNLAS